MELNEYQEKAMQTCMDSSNNFSYMFLNLVGEVGEFASKVAKMIRKGDMYIDTNEFISNDLRSYLCHDGDFLELKKEAGDIMWQISCLCKVMGWSLEDVCQVNLDKLASRSNRNVIDGNGDNR